MLPFIKNRIRTPIVIQMETVECGAAALSIILAYYGCFISLEELRKECGVSRSGVNAHNMIEAAKTYGISAEAFEVPYENIDQVKLPAILFWNFSHFVVLEHIGKKGAYINDPASGPRFVGLEEFKKSYSFVAIEMKPSSSFTKRGKPFNIFSRVKEKMYPYRKMLLYLLLLQVVIIFLGLIVPIFFQIFIDAILPNIEISWKMRFFTIFAITVGVVTFLTWSRQKFTNAFRLLVSSDLTSHFLWHVLHLPISFFTQRYGGEVIQRTNLNNDIADAVMGPLLLNCINLVLILLYLSIIAAYSIPIALIGLIAGGCNFLLLTYFNRVRTSSYADFQQKQAKVIGFSLDTLSSMETIKTNNASTSFFNRIANMYVRNINALQIFAKKDAWLSSISSFFQNLSTTTLIAIGFWYILNGVFTVGMFIGLQILLNMFLAPFNQIVQFGALLQSLRIDLNRVDDVLLSQPDPIFLEKHSYISPEKLYGHLTLKNITFGYSPRDNPLLNNCNMVVQPGEWIALVGSVGSGKSTLARIACQLYKPWSGEILYDNIPAEDFSSQDLKKYLSLIDQEIILFSGTITENISLWDETLSEANIIQAAQDAAIHDDIMERGYGYNTLVEEAGTNFSQGQKQRLEIARALVRNPYLLVLDEATNALDEITEHKVLSNLRKRKLSCLIITHRLSAIQQCDRIIVLERGNIVQSGTSNELAARPGFYRKLLEGAIIA